MKNISFKDNSGKLISILATGLSIDSRKIKPGEIFCACAAAISQVKTKPQVKTIESTTASTTTHRHGFNYLNEALKNGAKAILWEATDELNDVSEYQKTVGDVPIYRLDNLHQQLGFLAAQFYQQPSVNLQMVAITGTNGKTSVSHFIAQILTEQGTICGIIGTLGNGLYAKTQASSHTTPDAISVQKLLAQMLKDKAQAVVMEVSSHALHQYRVANVNFDIAVLTNLSRDHLDYHGNMENYGNEKAKLFQFKSLSAVVLNKDDEFSQTIISNLNKHQLKVLSYSLDEGESHSKTPQDKHIDDIIYAKNIHSHAMGSDFDLCLGELNIGVQLPLIGRFNISNALATAAVLYLMGFDFTKIASLLAELKSIPGRMETVTKNSDIQLVLDYAHTPDALKQALSALQQHKKNKLWCIFGCGGNRDKGKRVEMAKIASLYADNIIITSDNPRHEEPIEIIHDIEQGIDKNKKYWLEVDRINAIKLAISLAQQGDILLVAGKGDEDYQEIKGIRYPYSDRQTCQQLLAA